MFKYLLIHIILSLYYFNIQIKDFTGRKLLLLNFYLLHLRLY